MWEETGYGDIITEYFGNTSYFEPSLDEVDDMLNFIIERRKEYDLQTQSALFEGINIHHTCCNMLRHYAYWYINSLGYVDFKLKLKNYVDEDE
jgi:hypothetical protein